MSYRNSTCNTMAKCLIKILKPVTIKRNSFVKTQNIKKDVNIDRTDTLVSFGILILFTNVQVHASLTTTRSSLEIH